MNSNLHAAKTAKNDEFYTQLMDIEKELGWYKDKFRDKVVYCNCDNPYESKFVYYFVAQFNNLGLKRLIATSFNNETEKGLKLDYVAPEGDFSIPDFDKIGIIEADNDGDFRNSQNVALLQEADIVVTNPPFSLFREFVTILEKYSKDFLIIGSTNAITYKECFKMIKENKMWLGVGYPKEFVQPDGSIKKFGNISWFTNMEHYKRNEDIRLCKTYNEADYPKYDNYDAIEVGKVKDIPMDYDGVMGVPITFLGKYNPEQFKILGMDDHRLEYPK